MASMLSPETAPDPEPVPESPDTEAARTECVIADELEKTQARDMRVTAPMYGLIFMRDLWELAQ